MRRPGLGGMPSHLTSSGQRLTLLWQLGAVTNYTVMLQTCVHLQAYKICRSNAQHHALTHVAGVTDCRDFGYGPLSRPSDFRAFTTPWNLGPSMLLQKGVFK